MRRTAAVAAAGLALVATALTVRPDGARAQPGIEIHKVDEGHFSPVPDKPVFVLVVGLDGGRPGIDGDRADAIHLIGVNAAAGAGTMLNIPRDAFVAIPGRGQSKINDAYYYGGPGLMAETVEALTGADVAFVLAARFGPFENLVNEAGGVPVDVPIPMKDKNSGADFPQGRVDMDGRAALAFARNRYIPGGDFRRSEHQGLLILSALTKLRAENPGATGVARYLGILGRNVEITGVTPLELYRLGRLALTIDPAKVRSVTMPGQVGQARGLSVVLVAGGAVGLFADLRDDAVLQAH
ncbi:MAG TPA: LCP family protein [Acidimicrobiales bacterium]|nr:LCP family protein [Acidimicrobiales bacterium]